MFNLLPDGNSELTAICNAFCPSELRLILIGIEFSTIKLSKLFTSPEITYEKNVSATLSS